MYKCEFPLEGFSKFNSLLYDYCTDYFSYKGIVYGTSIDLWKVFWTQMDPDMAKWFENGDIITLIPPNTMKEVSKYKKTLTYVESTDRDITFYQVPSKLKDISDISKSDMQFMLSLQKFNIKGTPEFDKYINMQKYLELKPVVTHEIDMEQMIPAFESSNTFTIEDDLGNDIIVTRELFPRYKKISKLIQGTCPIDDNDAYSLFGITYDNDITMHIVIRFLRYNS